MTQIKSPVIQTDDYYPGGAVFNSYERENSVANKILFQETEFQDELGLNLYDYDARLYDPYTWRTPTLDPHAELYLHLSPYSFLNNNPVNFLDPTGMDAMDLNGTGGMALCPTCPQNDPKYQPYIDDPNNTYFYDPNSGNVSLQLDEVTVTADKPKAATNTLTTAPPSEFIWPEYTPLFAIRNGVLAAGTAVALTVALVFTPISTGNGEMEELEKMRLNYIPAPKTLPGFPGAQLAKRKAGRKRWKDSNGDILEWDSRHGDLEVYDKTGKHHKGSKNPETGEWTKPPDKTKTTEN